MAFSFFFANQSINIASILCLERICFERVYRCRIKILKKSVGGGRGRIYFKKETRFIYIRLVSGVLHFLHTINIFSSPFWKGRFCIF